VRGLQHSHAGFLALPPPLPPLGTALRKHTLLLLFVLQCVVHPRSPKYCKTHSSHLVFVTLALSPVPSVCAGYYNTETHPGGYAAIAALCAQYGASLTLTCVEMCDSQHPPEALCGPEGLLRAVRGCVWRSGQGQGGGS
jgi:hypothetical protein